MWLMALAHFGVPREAAGVYQHRVARLHTLHTVAMTDSHPDDPPFLNYQFVDRRLGPDRYPLP
ncbi:hypothetical protein D3C76_1750350 [compost metagenome]